MRLPQPAGRLVPRDVGFAEDLAHADAVVQGLLGGPLKSSHTCTRTRSHTYERTFTCTCVRMYLRTYVRAYRTYVQTYVRTYVYACAKWTRTLMNVCQISSLATARGVCRVWSCIARHGRAHVHMYVRT